MPPSHHLPNTPTNQLPAKVASPFSDADGVIRPARLTFVALSGAMGTAAIVRTPKLRNTSPGVRSDTEAWLAKWKPGAAEIII